MNLDVAVHTLLAQHPLVPPVRRQPATAIHAADVEIPEVALLAEVRLPRDQQVFVIGAMWHVTVAAIFLDRGVLPQEGAAFFSMAVVALFIERIADQVGRTGAAMWLVAIGASHQANVRR